MSCLIQNVQATFYCMKLGNLLKKLGEFSLFLNWEGACIRPKIWPRKIPDATFQPGLH